MAYYTGWPNPRVIQPEHLFHATEDGFFGYDLVEWNKQFSWFNKCSFDSTKNFSLPNKMVWLEQFNFYLCEGHTLRKKFGQTKQNLVELTKEFAYYIVDRIYGQFNQRICFLQAKMLFGFDLVKSNKYSTWFNGCSFDSTKYLGMPNKMVLLEEINFFWIRGIRFEKIFG